MADVSIANLPDGTSALAATGIVPVVLAGNTTRLTLAQVLSLLLPSGSVAEYPFSTAPSGWVLENGQTIGDAVSGATSRANADTSALFTLLWGQYSNTTLPIQDSTGAASTRGASAANDFSAHKRLPLRNRCGKMGIGAGQGNTAEGGGLGTNRVLGAIGGAETHTQTSGELALHTHTTNTTGGLGGATSVVASANTETPAGAVATNSTGSSTPMGIMNPFIVTNYIMKL
jgi:microcystin-dependent protein